MSNDHNEQVVDTKPATTEESEQYFFRASAEDFKKIPGSPIAYWVSPALIAAFDSGHPIGNAAKKGLSCSGTETFYRYFWEVSIKKLALLEFDKKWVEISKGGEFRKWYGNKELRINWEENGSAVKRKSGSVVRNESYYFRSGLSWNDVSSGVFSCRFVSKGTIPTDSGPMVYCDAQEALVACLLNSKVSGSFLEILCPTIHFGVGQIANFPVIAPDEQVKTFFEILRTAHKSDWDTYERSCDYQSNPLIVIRGKGAVISADKTSSNQLNDFYLLSQNYHLWVTKNRETIAEMKRLEEENNRLFIDAYGLADELTPDVPIEQITLTVNPAYRYKAGDRDKGLGESEEANLTPDPYTLFPKLAIRFREDTMKELISYAIGCMMGRYRLDRPGLIYAHSGNEDFWQIYDGKGVRDEGRGTSEKQRESEGLSGFDRLAEIDGVGGAGVPDDQDVSSGRAVRVDQPGSASRSIDSVEHSGGACTTVDQGVSELSLHRTGIYCGSGDTDNDRREAGICHTEADRNDHGSTQRNIQNAEQSAQQIKLTLELGDRGQGLGTRLANPLPLPPGTPAPNPFPPDDDGIVPITDMDWFDDDAANRVREFLLAVWGPDALDENMAFLAENLGKKSNETPEDTIRRYLSVSFFKDHLKTYKKRPIYWLFSSGKAKAFECLVYLHRYNEATLSRMRNEYVIPLQGKYSARADYLANEIEQATSASAQKKLQKEFDSLKKKQTELAKFDEELRHYADQRIAIDLDDGVKVNYDKFGGLLAEVKKVTGEK